MRIKTLLLATAMGAGSLSAPALAQATQAPETPPTETAPALSAATEPDAPDSADANNNVVVVGSQIRGSRVTEALPVTVIDRSQIDATGALTGDDLLRAIPQMGEVSFNPSNNPQTSNAARGDVNSINLRNLGTGNTLVLLNGRRLVSHPTSQAGEGNIPVLGPNANALPVAGIERLEILRDGASAIYGSDAVAGVVNTILRTDFDGLSLDGRYGWAEGTHREEWQLTGLAGTNFGGGRGNVTLYLDYTRRTAQLAEDQIYTATNDLRFLFADDPDFAGSLVPDDRATQSPWANLAVVGGPGTIRRSPGNQALTSSAGAFHTQSIGNPGCLVTINAETCLGSGTRATATTLRNERFDNAIDTTVSPSIRRFNSFLSAHYDISDSVTAYAEIGYYRASSHALQPPVINLNAIVIPASNYWNPFGPVTFANGQANPNRIPNLTNVPAAGLPVRLTTYRFVDTGPQTVDVTNWQTRFLGGLRGSLGGTWDFDTAILYSEAQATDVSPNVDMTALQQSLALSTPDAYNPFSGGCNATPSINDCTPSSQASIDAIVFQLRRQSRTTLGLADFKVSNASLFALPGGDVGIAFGIEGRRETQRDDRDPNLNGTITFRDAVTGETNLSNVAAVSPGPSTRGRRTVFSGFAEAAVPLVSPEMEVPLVRRFDLQLAARYEHYSDFGDVLKPKVAAAWDIVRGIRLRGSYSQGFRAPNLEQTKTVQYSRLGSNTDFYRCEADLRAGRIANFSACGRGISYSIFISGNPDLQPESSRSWTVGTVLEPPLPDGFGRLTLTADFWEIRQSGIVGQFGPQNALVLDYLLRLQGSSNPNVIRAAPTADDTPVFAGTGLAPAGAVLQIRDQFQNLLPQTVQGLDLGLIWNLRRTPIGNFELNLNASRLIKYSRDTPPAVQELFDARDAGDINAATPLTDASDLIRVRGKPRWRITGSLTWSLDNFQVGAFMNHIGSVQDTNFLDTAGNPYVLDPYTTFNLYAQYRFDNGPFGDTRVRVGVRNLFDVQPPLTAAGFLGSLYNPYARYWYVTVGTRF
ncbi:MAG TPA: TonB-dependent receptor [Allosphingosinicella sp.]|nr:TonB-dependent receptor [Allosphingosinicella sp.]